MSAKHFFLFIPFLFILISCNKNEQFPAKKFHKVVSDEVNIVERFSLPAGNDNDSIKSENNIDNLNQLFVHINDYDKRNPDFNLEKLKTGWKTLEISSADFALDELKLWIEITGFLLEITGDATYANELEETYYLSARRFSEENFFIIEKQITPWVFTKNVDHIQVNMFVPSAIRYEHTLKGNVEITQVTDYPESGKVEIKFQMENKRYIELYIRIPDWAENVSIIEKGVKYVAIPGTYSQIVRKWKEGNVVEISFSMDKKPEWLN